MSKKDFWNITRRPYTQLKLQILDEYINVWAKIFFNKAAANPTWKSWQKIYYIDCFAGRGRYHKDENRDSVQGSPILALECALRLQSIDKFHGITMKCIFVESVKNTVQMLENFCEPYNGKVEFAIHSAKNFNNVLPDILKEVGAHPAFFFIDPDGIKELKRESVEKIVSRSGPTDVLLNYIKGGVERIVGVAKKDSVEYFDRRELEKRVKIIKCLTDFYGLGVFSKLDLSERERLQEWTDSILKSSSLKEVAVFDMPYFHKSDNIYYLLFASREPVAKKVMSEIFKKAKGSTYPGKNLSLFGA